MILGKKKYVAAVAYFGSFFSNDEMWMHQLKKSQLLRFVIRQSFSAVVCVFCDTFMMYYD